MRIFPEEEERRVHRLELARGWRRSGLISPEQLPPIEAALGEPWACAGYAVRALLFGFTGLALAAVVFFYSQFFGVKRGAGVGWFMLLLAGPCCLLAESVVKRFRHYRFGVEEALFVGSAKFLCLGLLLVLSPSNLVSGRELALLISLVAAASGVWLYLRAGYLYAGYAVIAGLTAALGSLDLGETKLRLGLAALYAALLAASSWRRDVPDFERESWQGLRATLFLGVYLALNLKLESLQGMTLKAAPPGGGAFYWTTLALVWVLPPVGLARGLRARERALVLSSAMTALMTIVTLKPYLGLERRVWDAALLGAFLMGAAVALKRWLDAGPQGARAGFTARPLIIPRSTGLSAAALLAGGVAGQASAAGRPPPDKGFEGGGGRFGGGGAGGEF